MLKFILTFITIIFLLLGASQIGCDEKEDEKIAEAEMGVEEEMEEASGGHMGDIRLRKASFYEAVGDPSMHVLILRMEIDNLTDSDLYIESSSPTNEEGEKHLWFVVKDGYGNEYKPTYCSDIESSMFPMSVSPGTTTTGEMAWAIPAEASSVTLEVTQNVVGEKGFKVIYTMEIR